MARTNVRTRTPTPHTHEGGVASRITPIKALQRTVLAALLGEKTFYESGETLADRIRTLVPRCNPIDVAQLALTARNKHHLRHVPLLLVRELMRHPKRQGMPVADLINDVIQRPDEMGELLAIYWSEGRTPLAAQLKKGLARAFTKFDEYQLAKYNRDAGIKLRDVLFLSHSKPLDGGRGYDKHWRKAVSEGRLPDAEYGYHEDLYRRLVEGELKTPDTWEVALSSGADKRETFTRLLLENKLGDLALLRNLRNMRDAGVDQTLVHQRLTERAERSKVLPFRYLAAARACPAWEALCDEAMQRSVQNLEPLQGRTLLLLDHSGSMQDRLSAKSDLTRFDAACGVAILLNGICEDLEIWTFSSKGWSYRHKLVAPVPRRNGMALADAARHSMSWGGTDLPEALEAVDSREFDRIIVITDEQTQGQVPPPKAARGYLINVASYQAGVGYGDWLHINGFSEAVIKYLQAMEAFEEKIA